MKISHIAMYVQDLEKSRHFYETYFNATSNKKYHNIKSGLETYFLTFTSGASLELMHRPNLTHKHLDLHVTGFTHLAFSVGSKEKVDTLTTRLVNDGYTKISGPRITGDGYYESCILDNEHNQIEITV